MAEEMLRLDKFLWFARIAKTRSAAQSIVAKGRMRIDGRVTDRPSTPVKVGSVLTFAHLDRVRVLRVEALPARRGPAPEAAALLTDLAAQSAVDAPAAPK
ncbi:MAG: RNA-binding S4 domain-containing protein [Sphingomonadaceae bacterium]